MKAFVVTGHIVDFENRLYNLFEPEFFESFDEAEQAAIEMVKDEQSHYEDPVELERERVGDDEYDYIVNGHTGRLLEVKVRYTESF